MYFQRHRDDDPDESVPGRDALKSWPKKIQAKVSARLIAVAAAPPYRFAGGGYWEAMSADMAGFHELRVDGDNRHHYRLFCMIDSKASGATRPYLVVVDGLDKKFNTTLSQAQYAAVRNLGEEYLRRNPRSLYSGT